MKNKWYLSAFLVALAIVGISLEQVAVPNQEIIIQFPDTETKLDQTQEAIALVQNQLKAIDVDTIRIEELVNGTLKITYYSDIEVSEIKKIVSNALEVGLENSSFNSNKSDNELPFEKELEHYHLDIFKIQDSNDLDGAVGFILESKSETTRSPSLKTYATFNKQSIVEKEKIEKLAYNTHKNTATAINNSSNKIPEVRAGPIL